MRSAVPFLKWMGAIVLLSAALLWVGDALSVRYRLAHKTAANPLETLSLSPVYAIARKDGKAEFDVGEPQRKTCIHSIFPHEGYNPCWYVIGQSRKPIPIGDMIEPSDAAESRMIGKPSFPAAGR